jgi:hypothetical protein
MIAKAETLVLAKAFPLPEFFFMGSVKLVVQKNQGPDNLQN